MDFLLVCVLLVLDLVFKENTMKKQPTTKLWKLLEKPSYTSGSEYCKALDKGGYRVSDWVVDVCSKPDFPVNTIKKWPVPLVRVRLDSLGFSEPTILKNFYEVANKEGFENPPPEVALALRFIYDEQPTGEWLRVATGMDQMIDSDGVPHLPKLGAALKRFYLETYWAYPKAVFHPHNEFVMIDRRLG